MINQPAGHLEFGETLLEAIHREVLRNHAGFHAAGLVGVYQWTLPGSKRTICASVLSARSAIRSGRTLDPTSRPRTG